MRSSQSILENPTIRVTSSRVAHFVDLTSLERLPSRMSPDYLPRHSTCKRSPWANVASVNAEAAPWEVLYHQPFALWLSLSVNRYGLSTSNKSFPIITYLSNMFDTSTIASFSETLDSSNFPHTKSFSTKASTWEAIRTLKPGPYPERPRKRIFMAIGCFHVHW